MADKSCQNECFFYCYNNSKAILPLQSNFETVKIYNFRLRRARKFRPASRASKSCTTPRLYYPPKIAEKLYYFSTSSTTFCTSFHHCWECSRQIWSRRKSSVFHWFAGSGKHRKSGICRTGKCGLQDKLFVESNRQPRSQCLGRKFECSCF